MSNASAAALGRWSWVRPAGRASRTVLPLLVVLAAALAAALYLSAAVGQVGPFKVQLSAAFAPHGGTTFSLPPFGEVSADTHRLPLALRVTLLGVNLSDLQRWVGKNASAEAALASAEGSLRPLVVRFIAQALLLAAALGGIAVATCRRKAGEIALGALAGALLMAGVTGGVALQYDQSAFARPRYQGALEAAPWVVGLLQQNWRQFGGVGTQVETLTKNLSGLSDRLTLLSTVAQPAQDLRLLHVSDLHNNPLGLRFVAEAVKAFKVDAVVDTGDLTDFGTPLEGELFRDIAGLGVPYYFTPGNHDTPYLLRQLQRYRNIHVLDGETAVFRGLTILGAADPSSRRTSPEVASAGELAGVDQALLAKVESSGRRVDVVAVHNRLMARSLAGKVGVVLHGHDHRLSVAQEAGTTVIDAGTTGAAGLRGLQTQAGEDPYSMALLYFSRTGDGYRLQAVDTLEVRGKDAGFTLNRILVGTEEKSTAPANAH